MLTPQVNRHRCILELDGLWEFAGDEEARGEDAKWYNTIPNNTDTVPIKSSWNDLFMDSKMRYLQGEAWYFKSFYIPETLQPQNTRMILRIEGAAFRFKCWINGRCVGEHTMGFLPFEADVTSLLKDKNLLAIKVSCKLTNEMLPVSPQDITVINTGSKQSEKKDRELIGIGGTKVSFKSFPFSNADYYPYGGINRPVRIVVIPETHIKDITVRTDKISKNGIVHITTELSDVCQNLKEFVVKARIGGQSIELNREKSIFTGTVKIDNAKFWSPKAPHIYDLTIELTRNKKRIDEYLFPVGIRKIEVKGNKLFLNGKMIFLKGFGRHEDFFITGRGQSLAVDVRDYNTMKWCGANAVRLVHYPHSEEELYLADRMGILVLCEVPATGMFNFDVLNEDTLSAHKDYIQALVDRDKNHPSIIVWNLANEAASTTQKSADYFKNLFAYAKKLDTTRPFTIVSSTGIDDKALKYSDIICLNRYFGWYTQAGDLQKAAQLLKMELDLLFRKHKKPIILTEFGVDTIAGMHTQPAEMFSEEYQVEFIKTYCDVLESLPYVVGEFIWCYADFKTAQNVLRTLYNRKGVFTRDRNPKMAAHYIRQRWDAE